MGRKRSCVFSPPNLILMDPVGLELPEGAIDRRKSSVKIRKNATSLIWYVENIKILLYDLKIVYSNYGCIICQKLSSQTSGDRVKLWCCCVWLIWIQTERDNSANKRTNWVIKQIFSDHKKQRNKEKDFIKNHKFIYLR